MVECIYGRVVDSESGFVPFEYEYPEQRHMSNDRFYRILDAAYLDNRQIHAEIWEDGSVDIWVQLYDPEYDNVWYVFPF